MFVGGIGGEYIGGGSDGCGGGQIIGGVGEIGEVQGGVVEIGGYVFVIMFRLYMIDLLGLKRLKNCFDLGLGFMFLLKSVKMYVLIDVEGWRGVFLLDVIYLIKF